MSLDVSLYQPHACEKCWRHQRESGKEVFSSNITNNLGRMAEEAGIYMHLWRPEEIGVTTASQLAEPLREGLRKMKFDPEKFKAFNALNGWGIYENFVPWVEAYLKACEHYPESTVSVSR